ncbi:hypothetical protein ANCCAN_27050 [Ancylostoma caninum]|uniref:Transposase n=1 Tax=Ancylostoma caninum TaxID=29170 RepID=A0A368FAK9_ANCCA|nr:hypothetical protein ANCCAN_27050 [Ancylostoma caninum]
MFKGNLEACVLLITTGVRFVELNRFAEQMSLFSSTFFWKIFSIAKPVIEAVYCRHENHIMEVVRSHYEGESGLQLAADGAYDSRGYSALIGKVVLSDTLTKLILRTEVLHRSETAGISQRMEIEGLRRLLRWISAEGLTVASLTTDRSRSVGKLLREMEEETGVIQHYYDGWHLVKWLGKLLKEGITGPYNCCSHGELVGPRPETLPLDSDAYQTFRNIVLTKSFQRDLAKASPYGGTSICETKHALDRLYCRKEIFYPVSTYHLYAKLATMHGRMLDVHEDCLDTDQLPDEIGEMMMAEEASESGYSVEL